jgi:hypothetical protein
MILDIISWIKYSLYWLHQAANNTYKAIKLTVNMVLKGSLSDQICFYLINVIKQKMLFGIRMQSNGFIKKVIRFKEPYSTIGLQFGVLPFALILQKMKSFMDKPCCQKNLNWENFENFNNWQIQILKTIVLFFGFSAMIVVPLTLTTRSQFQQHFMSSICASRSRNRKKRLTTWLSFLRFWDLFV